MKRFFVGKSRLCLLALLCALFFVRISLAETGESGTCQYIRETSSLTIKPVPSEEGGATCELADNTSNKLQFNSYPWTWDSYSPGSITTLIIENGVQTPENASYLFLSLKNVTDWSALANLDVSKTKNFRGMFEGCSNFNALDVVSGWATGGKTFIPTNMSYMFRGCSSLSGLTALDGWKDKLSNVTDMSYMFDGCSGLLDLTGIGNWDVSNVKNMEYMFQSCSKLTNLAALDGWKDKLSNVTNIGYMFNNCSELVNLTGIKDWNVSNVKNMSQLLSNCTKLNDLSPISSWAGKLSNVTTVQGMFFGCTALTSQTAISNWNLGSSVNKTHMFRDCTSLKKADFSTWTLGSQFNMFLNVTGATIKLNQYYKSMYGTNLYIYGKHSYSDFTATDLQSDPDNLIFQPCKVKVTAISGATGHGSAVLSDKSNLATTAEAQAFFDVVKVWNNDISEYDASYDYYKAGGSCKLTASPETGYRVSSIKYNTEAQTLPTTTAPTFSGLAQILTLSDIKKDYDIEVELEQMTPAVVKYTTEAETGTAPGQYNGYITDTITLPDGSGLSKQGYHFSGWNDGTAELSAGTSYTVSAATVTMSAVFTVNQSYTITYDKGDATKGTPPAQDSVVQGLLATVKDNTDLEKTGYIFGGWKRSDNELTVQPGDTFTMPGENITLTAVFGQLYTLTYAKGDAETGDAPSPVSVVSGATVTVSGNIGNLEKTGYVFNGWKRSDNGLTVQSGTTLSMPERDITLTAQFVLGSYTITYEMGEATSGTVPDPQTADYNTAVTLSANSGNLAKGNAPYIGWTDGVTEYAETQSFLMPAYDITLKPLFSTLYKLSFAKGDAEAGSVPESMDVYYNTTVTLPGNTGDLTKAGYVFKCWQDNEGTEYQAGASYEMPKANMTLTAVFIPNSRFDITYEVGNAESGTAPAPQTGIPAGTTVTLAENSGGLAKQGYEFTYWSDGLKWYAPGSDFLMPSEDVTLRPYFVIVLSEDPLPEDEIGTYYYNESGQKEYVQFHNYDICMNYMGDENLCRNTSVNLYN